MPFSTPFSQFSVLRVPLARYTSFPWSALVPPEHAFPESVHPVKSHDMKYPDVYIAPPCTEVSVPEAVASEIMHETKLSVVVVVVVEAIEYIAPPCALYVPAEAVAPEMMHEVAVSVEVVEYIAPPFAV